MDFAIRIILCVIYPPLAVFDKGSGAVADIAGSQFYSDFVNEYLCEKIPLLSPPPITPRSICSIWERCPPFRRYIDL